MPFCENGHVLNFIVLRTIQKGKIVRI